MAYLFIDDQHPEVEEYTTNYIYFNEKEPGAFKKMMHKLKAKENQKKKGYELLKDDFDQKLSFA